MKLINRSAIVVRYREPYLRWAGSIDEKAPVHGDLRREDFSVYLLPEDPLGEQESAPLENYFGLIFEKELEDWCQDESLLPTRRDFATFRQWFDVQATSVVTDLGSSPLESEAL